jgi:HAMP domain-containing protein
MGNAGTPQGRLRRALASGDPLLATTAAADVERLVLDDALALAVLLTRACDRRGSRAAARAAGRYALELPRVDIEELGLLVAGFDRLARGDGALGLRLLVERRGLPAVMEQIDRSS